MVKDERGRHSAHRGRIELGRVQHVHQRLKRRGRLPASSAALGHHQVEDGEGDGRAAADDEGVADGVVEAAMNPS